ncbi:type II toxin-antitoxin system RelE/ParE family toxin [Roseateles terrae]|uniref:Plasmid stabilization system protein ParE n=1 Tax=Roseateles terrae TaxID=431060 RepID=A0ABR6GVF7_9BURK|nr:type II toxin-antitoxin system RelE/ParE family toxin [Roseateles terrae]MBB3196087.1 plasmid stabilization system protein ParE [Roseateles terrae]OWQ85444.1 hypothetical protein CDN98_16080 [Roseateles terrae]
MKVRLHREAVADIQGIATYVAELNASAAARLIEELNDKVMGLSTLAHAFPLLQGFEHLAIRRRVHGRYRILYRITDDDRVDVLRVLHTARDVVTAFLDRPL